MSNTSHRLDRIAPGSTLEITTFYRNAPHDPERVVFLGIEGSGDDRRAKFMQTGPDGKPFTWDAYRYGGRWAYGSSADRLRVDAVLMTTTSV